MSTRTKHCPKCKEPLDTNCQGEITCTSCNPLPMLQRWAGTNGIQAESKAGQKGHRPNYRHQRVTQPHKPTNLEGGYNATV